MITRIKIARGHYEYTEYEEYQKLQVAFNQVSSKLSESKLLRKYHFLFENIDSTKLEGKSIIPIYMEKNFPTFICENLPLAEKTVLLADKQVNFGEFIDNRGVSAFLNRLYEDVNIYDNNIPLFTNEFLSPIADVAPTLYRYYIRDTTVDQTGQKLVRIYFTPRNSADFLFRGEMVITLDSNYSVTKLNMYISPNINLNFVREMHIDQDFERGADGRYYVIRSNVMAEAGLSKENSGGFFAERIGVLPRPPYRLSLTIKISTRVPQSRFLIVPAFARIASGPPAAMTRSRRRNQRFIRISTACKKWDPTNASWILPPYSWQAINPLENSKWDRLIHFTVLIRSKGFGCAWVDARRPS